MSKLYLIATPIGNLDDITYRAINILSSVDALACEDTRHTRKIFEKFNIQSPKTIFSYHEHNEEKSGKRIIGLLKDGQSVALCTDGGYPAISDPGFRVIYECIENDIPIEVLPGANAVLTSLIASGLPTSSYTFKGFPPRKSGQRKKFLEMEKDLPHTLILFESPYRVGKLLADAFEVLGNRKAAVCIEMTKMFEEVDRNYLFELSEKYKDKKIKGEVTIIIAGNNSKFIKDEEIEKKSKYE